MNFSELWRVFDFKIALVVFFAYLAIDAMFAYYTLSVTRKRPVIAASVGATMYIIAAFGVINYIENYLYVIPLALGAWIGTYLVVKYDKDKKEIK